MKKSLLLFGILFGTFNASRAISVTLPSEEVLSGRLRAADFKYLVEKTNLVDQLAGQEKEVLGVIVAVEQALLDYAVKQPTIAFVTQKRKPRLIEIILQDAPKEAIEEAQDLLRQIAE